MDFSNCSISYLAPEFKPYNRLWLITNYFFSNQAHLSMLNGSRKSCGYKDVGDKWMLVTIFQHISFPTSVTNIDIAKSWKWDGFDTVCISSWIFGILRISSWISLDTWCRSSRCFIFGVFYITGVYPWVKFRTYSWSKNSSSTVVKIAIKFKAVLVLS